MKLLRFPHSTFLARFSALLILFAPLLAFAVSVSDEVGDPSVKAEKESFTLKEGYEISLFASEEMGIANPIAIRWDAKGRLWVLTTLTYAQLEPGENPDDKLLILEDTDGDGKADSSKVWADKLNMPTGFALGNGGVYISEGTDLIFLKDSDEDGKADHRQIIMSGFGTGDTHQNINSLSWGPAGDLWFSQGLHNLTRVETPWGIVRGEEAGIYRLRVEEQLLEPFCMHSMASQNPWGINFGRWGELFVKSNNRELGYITPGMIPTDHYQNIMKLGTVAVTPGKSMGCEIVESSSLPDLSGHVLIAGYYSNRVTAFPLVEDGSGFKKTEAQELLVSSHPSFRPVEIKVGPDGALYVADWFNPIIGHYQASLRHPNRDKSHGRVWRIVAKDAPLQEKRDLTSLDQTALMAELASPERWNRYHAKRLLSDSPTTPEGLRAAFDAATDLHHRYELLGVMEAHDEVSDELIATTLKADESHLRAYGARMIGRWAGDLEDAEALLTQAVQDEDARVRLEAVIAASHVGTPHAMKLALQVLDQPVDRFIQCSLTQTVHALSSEWLPALEANELEFENLKHLTFALSALGGEESAEILDRMVAEADPGERRELLLLLATVGDSRALAMALEALPTDLELLTALNETWQIRRVRPAGQVAAMITPALRSEDSEVVAMGLYLVANWQVKAQAQRVEQLALNDAATPAVRRAGLHALVRIQGPQALPKLKELAGAKEEDRRTRLAATDAIASFNVNQGAPYTADLLRETESVGEASGLLAPYLNRRDGVEPLAGALESVALSKESASNISQALTQAGRSDAALTAVLNRAMGVKDGTLAYSPEFVAKLVEEVKTSGNAEVGKKVYQSPLISCVACHAIQGQGGGVLGPDLTTVGSGLPLDLIVESVLWPERQLKEGYFSINVTTKDGKLYNGYREKEDEKTLFLRDIASQKTVPIPLASIQQREDVGTLMPAGLTASLSREELRDLLRYLWELRG